MSGKEDNTRPYTIPYSGSSAIQVDGHWVPSSQSQGGPLVHDSSRPGRVRPLASVGVSAPAGPSSGSSHQSSSSHDSYCHSTDYGGPSSSSGGSYYVAPNYGGPSYNPRDPSRPPQSGYMTERSQTDACMGKLGHGSSMGSTGMTGTMGSSPIFRATTEERERFNKQVHERHDMVEKPIPAPSAEAVQAARALTTHANRQNVDANVDSINSELPLRDPCYDGLCHQGHDLCNPCYEERFDFLPIPREPKIMSHSEVLESMSPEYVAKVISNKRTGIRCRKCDDTGCAYGFCDPDYDGVRIQDVRHQNSIRPGLMHVHSTSCAQSTKTTDAPEDPAVVKEKWKKIVEDYDAQKQVVKNLGPEFIKSLADGYCKPSASSTESFASTDNTAVGNSTTDLRASVDRLLNLEITAELAEMKAWCKATADAGTADVATAVNASAMTADKAVQTDKQSRRSEEDVMSQSVCVPRGTTRANFNARPSQDPSIYDQFLPPHPGLVEAALLAPNTNKRSFLRNAATQTMQRLKSHLHKETPKNSESATAHESKATKPQADVEDVEDDKTWVVVPGQPQKD